MAIQTSPIPYPPSASPLLGESQFGVIVEGVKPASLTPEELKEVQDLLYKHSLVVFRGVPREEWGPEAQYLLTKSFDPNAETYGHGNNKTGKEPKSILHPDLKTIPSQPQVQLIGHGLHTDPYITRGLEKSAAGDVVPVKLKHPHHKTFHQTVISDEDEETKRQTRFYRWHIDAALYKLAPPVATTLYALSVPQGPHQTVMYDDGTGETLDVPLGTTAFVSGKLMFERLSPEMKSLAVRSRVRYAPHPYVWMTPAKAMSTGLGIVSEGKELPLDQLPPWTEEEIKTFPLLWKNPVTGDLHFQVHPCGIQEVLIDPAPTPTESTLYPTGGHLTDLEKVRELVYSFQRPAIKPELVYPHDWKEGDLCVFHNRGVLHTVVGAFKDHEKRAFWQCNLAASHDPVGPSEEDIKKYA